ncbi:MULTISPECIES: LysR substrate-binding domain-containing protein [unclassified Rathayibacter]|uniref:LysR substrate-binding domain-containing protein n=1 Tax=unclassified Rathayibacter TaxID=2609250 RepID=UPI000CE7A0C3|nr:MULTISPECIES: LysR substrate-binding domain-containing protein [unclassified Rathayibacter]PPF29595.1 LysR family transcriptional regulator [Rathayibacter sp. AY1F2]PPH43054.1 LysR family transcriptional regulator [Rathayibacter sp. AY1F7]
MSEQPETVDPQAAPEAEGRPEGGADATADDASAGSGAVGAGAGTESDDTDGASEDGDSDDLDSDDLDSDDLDAEDSDSDAADSDAGDAVPAGPVLAVALVPGVTPTKWTRVWGQRRSDLPLRITVVAERDQEQALLDGRAQLSFVRGDVSSSALSSIHLYDEQPVAVVGREHALAAADELDVAELAGEHLLQDPEDVPEWAAVAEELADGSRRPLPRMAGLDDAVEQVAAGVGVLIVPQSVARVHSRKDVTAVPVTGVAPSSVRLAWVTDDKGDDVEDFIGVVRGRSANTTRGTAATPKVESRAKAAKAKAREAREKAERAGGGKKKPARAKASAPAVRRTRKPRGR